MRRRSLATLATVAVVAALSQAGTAPAQAACTGDRDKVAYCRNPAGSPRRVRAVYVAGRAVVLEEDRQEQSSGECDYTYAGTWDTGLGQGINTSANVINWDCGASQGLRAEVATSAGAVIVGVGDGGRCSVRVVVVPAQQALEQDSPVCPREHVQYVPVPPQV